MRKRKSCTSVAFKVSRIIGMFSSKKNSDISQAELWFPLTAAVALSYFLIDFKDNTNTKNKLHTHAHTHTFIYIHLFLSFILLMLKLCWSVNLGSQYQEPSRPSLCSVSSLCAIIVSRISIYVLANQIKLLCLFFFIRLGQPKRREAGQQTVVNSGLTQMCLCTV